MNGLSVFKEVLDRLVVEAVVSDTTRGCLVDVLEGILVLLLTLAFVKELFVLGMHAVVAFAVCDVSSVVPGSSVLLGELNPLFKTIH